jgi:hypothetical protein
MPTALKYWRGFSFSILFVVLGGLCIIGNGCATGPRYQSTVSSPADGAQVRGTFKGFPAHWYKLTLEQVDGKKVNLPWWKTDWHTLILLDPGDRMLRVRCQFATASRTGSGTADFVASFQAGHTYQLRCDRQGDVVTFWVADTKTQLNASKQIAATTSSTSIFHPSAADGTQLLLRVLVLIGTGG